jgi:hypothetical protein
MIFVICPYGTHHQDALSAALILGLPEPNTKDIVCSIGNSLETDSFVEFMKGKNPDPHHKFVLYRDYYTHPKIDEILYAIYDYKMALKQDLLPFAKAIRATDKRATIPTWLWEMTQLGSTV